MSTSAKIFFGLTRDSGTPDKILFALDVDPNSWIAIPKSMIEKVEPLGAAAGQHVRLSLKNPVSEEAQVFSALASGTEKGLLALARKVQPALNPATQASDACMRCLNACSQIVVTEDDPFAQIRCMLTCADCP